MKATRYTIAGMTVAAMSLFAAPALAETVRFAAELKGAAEAAEISESATGHVEATLDTGTGILEWVVTYSGLSGEIFAAHIHGPAEPGEDAGIQIGLDPIQTSPISGSGELTEQQMEELMAGKYYVNLHTEQHRGGEILGTLEIVDAM